MSETLRSTLIFLISTLFDIYLFILIIRVILVYVESDYYNPVTQFIVKATSFIIKPLRHYIPDYHRIELASVALILVLELIKFLIISILSFGFPNNIIGLIIIVFGDTIKLTIETFFYTILLQAILSWIQPGGSINRDLERLTSPILRPLQRFIPPISGLDITPLIALVILQLIIILFVNKIIFLGWGVAFGHK